jgi:Omp85 superfamily domain
MKRSMHDMGASRNQLTAIRRWAIAAGMLLLPATLHATSLECEVNADCPGKAQGIAVPYGFYNEATGLAAAVAVVGSGYLQPQFAVVGNIFAGTNDTVAGFLLARNFQVVEEGRLFLDLRLLAGRWGELKTYQNGNPAFASERAGANNSNEDNFFEVEGSDQYYRATLRYLLPIGAGKEGPIHVYRTRSGLLEPESASGGREWNPLRSGVSTLELEPFYRKRSLENPPAGVIANPRTAGGTLRLKYDNTDWPKNPSYGSRTTIGVSRDWGGLDDAPSWTQVEFQFSKYFSLGETARARQRVVAFDVWVSDSPTWYDPATINGQQGFHRPPTFLGSTLGGLERQRGFDANRFSDKAAINYQLEYRHIPAANPLAGIQLLKPLQIKWVQYVAFVEVGRVAEHWHLKTLHEDMKISYGVGARAFALGGLVVRVDLAFSKEAAQVQMFIGQTF